MDAPIIEQAQLKFVIVGHVDHGKSTLIGRLLFDTESLPPERMEEIRRASDELGHDVEFAYVMDHLEEERSQGITIDTAQIFFSTPACQYVIIDAPGHREFIQNMVTGASEAEAAVFILDADEGIREQTRRHAYVLSLLGIEQVIVAVNKMDLVEYKQDRFEQVKAELLDFFSQLGIEPIMTIPVSAKLGENIARKSDKMPWYRGPILLDSLGELSSRSGAAQMPLRLPIQDCYDFDDKAILAGRIEAGTIQTGQDIVFIPSGKQAKVASIEILGPQRTSAEAGESIGITLDDTNGIHRGQVACPVDAPAITTDRFSASIFWLSKEPLDISEPLKLRCSTQQVGCKIEKIERLIDTASLELLATDAEKISATQVAHAIIKTDKPIAIETFVDTPELGRFVLLRKHDVEAGGIVVSAKATG